MNSNDGLVQLVFFCSFDWVHHLTETLIPQWTEIEAAHFREQSLLLSGKHPEFNDVVPQQCLWEASEI